MPYIATFDVGTTAVKGVLVDLTGQAVRTRSLDIPTIFNGSCKEQNPACWWAAFLELSQEFTTAVSPADIQAIVMSGQMQDLIPLDEAFEPVGNAILYSDGRAEAQAQTLTAAVGADRFLSITGNRCDGSLPLPKLMWLRQEEPERYARVRHVLISAKDYLVARLTGRCCGDVTACSTAGAMDIRRACWDTSLLSAAGLPPALFPTLYAPHQQVGGVLAAGSGGYLPGTPVFAGIGDAGATTLASGIAQPGQYNINLGTSGWVATVSKDVLLHEAGVFNLAAAERGRYINVVPFLNAGNVHQWITGVLCGKTGSPDYPALSALLANSVPGSHGTLFLPYLAGERFPVLDPSIQGCYLGLTPQTTAADLARAALEGVAFSLRQGFSQLPTPVESLSLIGGGGREAAWCQILADVLDQDIAVFRDVETLPSMAVASIALVGLGVIDSYVAFTSSLRQAERCVLYRPQPSCRGLYNQLFTRHSQLYAGVRPLFSSAV